MNLNHCTRDPQLQVQSFLSIVPQIDQFAALSFKTIERNIRTIIHVMDLMGLFLTENKCIGNRTFGNSISYNTGNFSTQKP